MNDNVTVYFTRTNNFKSKKNNKEYFTVEYLTTDGLKHYTDFITKEQYEEIEEMALDPLEEVNVIYKIGYDRNLVFDRIER